MAKILLVEDEEDVRYTIAKLLTRAGHDVIEVENGLKAMAAVTDEIQIVITDLVMPEVEGIELVQKLKAQWPALPIIAISGGGRTRAAQYLDVVDAMGVDASFPKPLAEKDFLETVIRLTA